MYLETHFFRVMFMIQITIKPIKRLDIMTINAEKLITISINNNWFH